MAPPRATSVSVRVTIDGVLVPVRLTPKAGRNRIDGVKPDADGTRRLAVSVTAGAEARAKLVRVAGDPARILERINRHGYRP